MTTPSPVFYTEQRSMTEQTQFTLDPAGFMAALEEIRYEQGLNKAKFSNQLTMDRTDYYAHMRGARTIGNNRFVKWLTLLGYEAHFTIRKKTETKK